MDEIHFCEKGVTESFNLLDKSILLGCQDALFKDSEKCFKQLTNFLYTASLGWQKSSK